MGVTNSRREFFGLAAGALAAAGLFPKRAMGQIPADKPALLGGVAVHTGGWPRWPEWRQTWEPSVLQVLRSGQWYRGAAGTSQVQRFEAAYAELLGAKRCLATASGTTALMVGMHVLDVDAGDEVIVSPFTFIASYNAILLHKALPVFADTDPATLTMDPASIESRITERTRALMPVHIYGMPCDMDPIMAVARKHRLAVIEDACQAWLADYKGRKCGTIGDLGCFSFQNSKHLPSGEGARSRATATNSSIGRDRSTTADGPTGASRARRTSPAAATSGCSTSRRRCSCSSSTSCAGNGAAPRQRGTALRVAEGDSRHPPARLPENSEAVWHLYPFRYDAEKFQGLSREKFIKAMRAEGIPCSSGIPRTVFRRSPGGSDRLARLQAAVQRRRLKAYRDSLQELKGNRQVCATTVAVTQNLLLAEPADIDHIAAAIRKIQAHGAELART